MSDKMLSCVNQSDGLGTEFLGICTCIVSPNEFYVQMVGNISKLEDLETALERFYAGSDSEIDLRPSSFVRYCAWKGIRRENDTTTRTTWYRCEVLSVKGNEALVILMDYGSKLWLNINELRVLPKQFLAYGKMAQLYRLKGVPYLCSHDVNDYFKNLVWSRQKNSRLLKVNVLRSFPEHGSPLTVALSVPGTERTLNEDVINFMKSDVRSREEYDILVVNGVETLGHAYINGKLPIIGTTIQIKFLRGSCVSPELFYGYWCYSNECQNGRSALDDVTRRVILMSLISTLNAPVIVQNYKHIDPPMSGELVLARSRVDDDPRNGEWFRAQVLRVYEYTSLVLLIDFGETRLLSNYALRAIDRRFLQLPAQATEFRLSGVEAQQDPLRPYPGIFPILSKWTTFYALIVKGYYATAEVVLMDAEGNSLTNALIQSGFFRVRR